MVAIDVGEVILILVLIIIVAIILSGIHILKE